jgi:hypothetical protein
MWGWTFGGSAMTSIRYLPSRNRWMSDVSGQSEEALPDLARAATLGKWRDGGCVGQPVSEPLVKTTTSTMGHLDRA